MTETKIPLPTPLIQYRATFATIIGYTADQMHAHAAAVSAADNAALREQVQDWHKANAPKGWIDDQRERIKVLEDALRMALAELDELPVWSNTGHICNIARAALGDKTPTTQPPSPSPRS